MRYKKLVFATVILFISLSGCAQKPDYRKEIQAARDSVVRFMNESKIPGAAIAVSVNGKLVWSQGFGFADLEQKVPVDPARTKFRIGSISKSITATGLAVLYQNGKIQLDSSIYFYLPSYPGKKYRPTIRQLAGHNAGIRHYKGEEFFNTRHFSTVQEGLIMFQNDSLLFRPGTRHEYSSYGFNLLSATMESASGKDFISFMRSAVWKPLQLDNTGPDLADSLIEFRSRCYEARKGRWYNVPAVDNSYKWAGGGFLSSAEDVVKLANPYLLPGFLKKETIALFTTQQKLRDGSETGYGLGWASGKDPKGRDWFGHSGGSVGGTSDLLIYPKEKVAVAILTNLSSADFRNVSSSVAEIFIKQ